MGAILLKCKKCGRVYSIEKMDEKDGHQCICGEMLDKWSSYIGFCENVNAPNKPLGVWKRISSERPGFPLHHGDDDIEVVTPKSLSKKIKIDIEAGMGLDELIGKAKELRECIKDIQGPVMIDNDGKVNVVPVISIDAKAIVFRTITPHRKEDREAMEKEYSDKIGIKCVVLDSRTELVAVIDG